MGNPAHTDTDFPAVVNVTNEVAIHTYTKNAGHVVEGTAPLGSEIGPADTCCSPLRPLDLALVSTEHLRGGGEEVIEITCVDCNKSCLRRCILIKLPGMP